MNDEPIPTTQHSEPVTVAFTEAFIGGRSWKLTLKEGVTRRDIDRMLQMMAYAGERLDQLETPPEDFPDEHALDEALERYQPRTFSAPPAPGLKLERITRIQIGGTLEKPTVAMWASHPGLQYPVFTKPASMVIELLTRSYPELSPAQLEVLKTCGATRSVNWEVSWETSPKNPKWKDIVAIAMVAEG